jgi:hypothetical protein
VTDDFFTNLILVLVVPVIVVVGGLFVVKYLGAGMMQQAIKILLAVISFGFFVSYGNGLFMAIYEPSDPFHGEPLFWAPFTGLFLISTYLLLRDPLAALVLHLIATARKRPRRLMSGPMPTKRYSGGR